MPGLDLDDILKSLKITGEISVLNKPGAVNLGNYPHLAYAPSQWGPGVRTENNGTPVADIALAFSTHPNAEAVAAQFGVTVDHVNDALRYAAAVKYAEPSD